MKTPIQGAVSFCVGLLICLELAGCAHWPFAGQAATSVDRVVEARPEQRENLWRVLNADDDKVARALLQSLPGHSGYAPELALRSMRQLLADDSLEPRRRQLLRLRTMGLERELNLTARIEELDRRLQTLIEIEQQLDQRSP